MQNLFNTKGRVQVTPMPDNLYNGEYFVTVNSGAYQIPVSQHDTAMIQQCVYGEIVRRALAMVQNLSLKEPVIVDVEFRYEVTFGYELKIDIIEVSMEIHHD